MRPGYIVSNKEMLVELRDLQETLLSLIGYDSNSFDDQIDVSGRVDVLENSIDVSGFAFVNSRIYDSQKEYASLYRNDLILYYVRRSIND